MLHYWSVKRTAHSNSHFVSCTSLRKDLEHEIQSIRVRWWHGLDRRWSGDREGMYEEGANICEKVLHARCFTYVFHYILRQLQVVGMITLTYRQES